MTEAEVRRRRMRGSAEGIAEQLPRRRRRLGAALMALAVLGLALQPLLGVWLLPADAQPLFAVRELTHSPQLGAVQLAAGWALLCVALLFTLAAPERPRPLLAVLCGLALGSAYAAAGGSLPATALLALVGVATLGWQAWREGGLALLVAAGLSTLAWEWLSTAFPTLYIVVPVLVGLFVWIDLQHLRVNDRRLFDALAERDTLIQSLDQRTDELTALQGARTQLLASISHDLRQPLQAVRLYGQALQALPAPPSAPADAAALARRAELLRQQMRAADDAVAMLDQFSEFSAIEQGALQSHPELLDVREVLDGVAATLQATHPPAQLRIAVHGRAQWLHTDRTQLARLLQNLAGNAVRYSLGLRPGQPARVVLAVREHRWRDAQGQPQQGLALDVVDNGRGIPADKLDAVFEPYVQLAEGGGASRGGRGLGLAIVRGLVAQLGLQLAPVRSTPGRGTRFRVCVPQALRRSAPAPAAAAALGPAPEPDAARLDGWLLALLDDEPAARAALRAALEGVGATIVDAGSIEQLKLQLDDEPRFPDALVFDLDLGPGKPDGLAAVLDLRGEWEALTPAVIVTGRVAARGTLPLPKRCSLLAKPVDLPTLVHTLRRIVPSGTATLDGLAG